MTKTATVSARVDEEVKMKAQEAFDRMGLPLSLGIELFLREVSGTGRLPFSVGAKSASQDDDLELWKAFIVWYFRVWPKFNTVRAEVMAKDAFSFDCNGAGSVASAYIDGDTGGWQQKMTEEQMRAASDLSELQILLSEAKELIYWAMSNGGMNVPAVASRYRNQEDDWRLRYLEERERRDYGEPDYVADGVIGARYFGDDGLGQVGAE